jgi:hypothetical protein
MSGIMTMFVGAKKGLPQIGAAYEGGYFAGQISTTYGSGAATHNLVVAPVASGESSKQWKTTATTTGVYSPIDGPANSSAMNNASHPAAEFCEGLSIGGYTDWYMPAQDELEVCYYNLKPSTASNNTDSGANPYSVPSRTSTYYTSGTPAQTSATDFRDTGTQYFAADGYWSSTEVSAANAREQIFTNGWQRDNGKTGARRVRAVRRVPA